MILEDIIDPRVSQALLASQLVVLKTDTIYGILARASDSAAVSRLYRDRPRSPQKSCILLVSNINDIPGLTPEHQATYMELSRSRPTTVIVNTNQDFMPHLVRQQGTLAFRFIPPSKLADLIRLTGPLLAPSANPENQPPAIDIDQAMTYFGDKVSIYVDDGRARDTLPSKIIAIGDGDEIKVIRG